MAKSMALQVSSFRGRLGRVAFVVVGVCSDHVVDVIVAASTLHF